MDEPKDVREMRQIIQRASHGYDRIDGEGVVGNHINIVAGLIRRVLRTGECNGWSGEDTMTALAYYVLRDLEKSYDRELHMLNTSVSPRIMLSGALAAKKPL